MLLCYEIRSAHSCADVNFQAVKNLDAKDDKVYLFICEYFSLALGSSEAANTGQAEESVRWIAPRSVTLSRI